MNCLVQVAEVWLPDSEFTLLEFEAGLYGQAAEFGAVSQAMCFGRAEGLPGRAWDEAHPILLTDLQGSYFKRAAAARKAGLTCAAAIPVYVADTRKAVPVLFCGGEQREEGAVQLGHNNSRVSTDMTLVEGDYGVSAKALLANARESSLPRGSGLPGMAWQRESSVFMDGLPSSPRFLRAESAAASGIRQGLALPCALTGNDHSVLAMLGTEGAPIARRVESWRPTTTDAMQRGCGQCQAMGLLPAGELIEPQGAGRTAVELAFSTAVPQIRPRSVDEPGVLGTAAAVAWLGGVLALPICADGAMSEVVTLYF